MRIISNTTVMLREPLRLSGPGAKTPIEHSILNALGVDDFSYTIEGPRGRVESERERRWRAERAGHQSPG
jgi:hypothetical protein